MVPSATVIAASFFPARCCDCGCTAVRTELVTCVPIDQRFRVRAAQYQKALSEGRFPRILELTFSAGRQCDILSMTRGVQCKVRRIGNT